MQGSEDDLEALADSLEENVPPAPEMPPRSISEPQRVSGASKRLADSSRRRSSYSGRTGYSSVMERDWYSSCLYL